MNIEITGFQDVIIRSIFKKDEDLITKRTRFAHINLGADSLLMPNILIIDNNSSNTQPLVHTPINNMKFFTISPCQHKSTLNTIRHNKLSRNIRHRDFAI